MKEERLPLDELVKLLMADVPLQPSQAIDWAPDDEREYQAAMKRLSDEIA